MASAGICRCNEVCAHRGRSVKSGIEKRDRMSGNSHGKTGTIAVTTTDIHLARRGDGNLYLDRNGVRYFSTGQGEYLVRLKGTC